MIDTESDPGAWEDHIASTGRFRAVAAPAWKLVPVEPTEDMLYLGGDAQAQSIGSYGEPGCVYRAMLAAAPEPPADPMDDYYAKPCHSDPGRARPANAAALAEKDAEIAALRADKAALLEELFQAYRTIERAAIESSKAAKQIAKALHGEGE